MGGDIKTGGDACDRMAAINDLFDRFILNSSG